MNFKVSIVELDKKHKDLGVDASFRCADALSRSAVAVVKVSQCGRDQSEGKSKEEKFQHFG